jgi:outer membrane protein TolC
MKKAVAGIALGMMLSAVSAVPALAQSNPLTLEQCVAMALRSNLRIEAAAERLVEMDAAVGEAGTARMPRLSGQAAYTRLIPQPTTKVPIGVDLTAPSAQAGFAPIRMQEFEASGNSYTAGLSLTQALYTGGRVTNAQKITEHNRRAAGWQQESAVREIRRDVTKAYYQALAVNKGIVALDSAIALMEVMLRDLESAVEVGMRGEHELLQARVQLANQRLARQQTVTSAQTAHIYLATLIGVPVNTPITLVDELHAPELFAAHNVPALQTRAREASTDLKALEEQVKIIETSLLITGAANIPTVAASANYSGRGMGGFGGKHDFSWGNNGSLSLVLQWDIYDGGALKHKKSQGLSQKRQIELTIENLQANLDMLVKNNSALLHDAFASLETNQRNIEQARRSYEISYDKFREGMMLSSELLNAQNVTLQAEISYYTALSNFYAAQADLDYLVNEGK